MKKIIYSILCIFVAIVFVNVNALTLTEDITLEEDISEQVVVDGENVTINLNGHNIKGAVKNILYVTNGANVTIIGEGTIESTINQAINIDGGSSVVLKSGNVKSVETGVVLFGKSTFTMDGGTIQTVDNCGIAGNGSAGKGGYTINMNGGTINANIKSSGYVSCGIYHPNEGTVTIKGGVINSSNGAGIVQRAGTLNVEGGTINANGTSKGKVGDSRVVVTASAIVVDKEAAYPAVNTLKTVVSKGAVLNGSAHDIETIGNNVIVELIGGIYSEEPSEDLIPDDYVVYKVLDGDNKDKYVVVEEGSIENLTVDGMIPKDELSEEEITLIENAVKDKFKIVSYYDVEVITVTKDGDVVGYVTDSDKDITVKLGLPRDIPALEKDYTRKYYVVRVHDGKVTLIDDVKDNGDGTISFKSDKFSTYAVAYVDTKEETTETTNNPKTGDSILVNVFMSVICLSGFTGGLLYCKKIRS